MVMSGEFARKNYGTGDYFAFKSPDVTTPERNFRTLLRQQQQAKKTTKNIKNKGKTEKEEGQEPGRTR
ncbi:hypothetical protein Q5P01_011890 [Channa striata]|uniref:Uncharacterized protein n=1 Tax=Channa striata TaxID=64152 RepID=A0AA88SPP7_CHASR|nr:hypothetical protein Q5P01_011890 [Channa striata]